LVRLQEAIATGQEASRRLQEELASSISGSTNGTTSTIDVGELGDANDDDNDDD
jgi:hypothetical protein